MNEESCYWCAGIGKTWPSKTRCIACAGTGINGDALSREARLMGEILRLRDENNAAWSRWREANEKLGPSFYREQKRDT